MFFLLKTESRHDFLQISGAHAWTRFCENQPDLQCLKSNTRTGSKNRRPQHSPPLTCINLSMCKVQILRREREGRLAAGAGNTKPVRERAYISSQRLLWTNSAAYQNYFTSSTGSRALNLKGLSKCPVCPGENHRQAGILQTDRAPLNPNNCVHLASLSPGYSRYKHMSAGIRTNNNIYFSHINMRQLTITQYK